MRAIVALVSGIGAMLLLLENRAWAQQASGALSSATLSFTPARTR
jgi:hypothetical protein